MTATSLSTAIVGTGFSEAHLNLISGVRPIANDILVGIKTAPNTTDSDDSFNIDLWNEFGIKRLLGIGGWVHTTEGSVIVAEAPTTTINNGILTVTVGGSSVDNKKRVYLLVGC